MLGTAVQNAGCQSGQKPSRVRLPRLRSKSARASLDDCLSSLIRGLDTVIKGADDERTESGDPAQVKQAVEQLSRDSADSNAAAIEDFETAAPHLRIFFGAHKFEHFASLVQSYAFAEAYDELMAAGDRKMKLDPKI